MHAARPLRPAPSMPVVAIAAVASLLLHALLLVWPRWPTRDDAAGTFDGAESPLRARLTGGAAPAADTIRGTVASATSEAGASADIARRPKPTTVPHQGPASSAAARRREDLPGPRGWPLVGNALQIEPRRLHLILEDWAEGCGSPYHSSASARSACWWSPTTRCSRKCCATGRRLSAASRRWPR